MAEKKPQNLQNYVKIDPAFHRFLVPGALLLLAGAIYKVTQIGFKGTNAVWSGEILLGVIWAIVAVFKIRLYALKVQDRLIRLEERLRLERLLSDPWKSRMWDLTEPQLIALRFASDAELPALVEKTLSSSLDPKAIKQAIQVWRPDYFRV